MVELDFLELDNFVGDILEEHILVKDTHDPLEERNLEMHNHLQEHILKLQNLLEAHMLELVDLQLELH